jgi:hypothetical protein
LALDCSIILSFFGYPSWRVALSADYNHFVHPTHLDFVEQIQLQGSLLIDPLVVPGTNGVSFDIFNASRLTFECLLDSLPLLSLFSVLPPEDASLFFLLLPSSSRNMSLD